MIFRRAEYEDIESILAMQHDTAFSFSEHMGYSENELNCLLGKDWPCARSNWNGPFPRLLVVEDGGVVAGFLVSTPLTCEWVQIDGLFVKKECRGRGIGKFILSRFEALVLHAKISYVSTITPNEDVGCWLRRQGYATGRQYVWFDKVIK